MNRRFFLRAGLLVPVVAVVAPSVFSIVRGESLMSVKKNVNGVRWALYLYNGSAGNLIQDFGIVSKKTVVRLTRSLLVPGELYFLIGKGKDIVTADLGLPYSVHVTSIHS